ncbi:patatin-like phospholipase family protein [Vibrio hannami]|uniref:patatin-like phospholipase family protein n=1 Tax=Vibrio hannami TaxID=2717094 RepID=UPI00240ED44D|nr:patatin-like phospholipase family protein [Vibrio hannami]MDG3087048.1 patatin-like phospholipase family protein [Vibrio hannami]
MIKGIIALGVLAVVLSTPAAAADNHSYKERQHGSAYSIRNFMSRNHDNEYEIIIAMSGGGTRAAAFAYGVLKALRAETLPEKNHQSLLDEVDVISSVSGGSFTAAYYGLYGNKIFSDFEPDFLYTDVESELYSVLLKPSSWFSKSGRTGEAIEYYQERLFGEATFADIQKAGGPLIIINATDLGNRVRFSFLQEFFDPLCSNLSTYPVANAVAASAAVPVVFNPVVLENYDTCDNSTNRFLESSDKEISKVSESTWRGLVGYRDKENKKYVHLVDGGISDNLGLLSLYDTAEIGGGHEKFIQRGGNKIPKHYIIISIDASVSPERTINLSPDEPSITDTVSAMSEVQFFRYNTSTRQLIEDWVDEYVKLAAERNIEIEPYIININFSPMAIIDEKRRKFLNNIPTDLTLEKEQVDIAIEEGFVQLQNHPDFLRFRRNIAEEAKKLSTTP